MTLKDYQTQVDQWIQNIGVRYFNELTNMALLTEEVGELARLMARTYGEQSWKEGKQPQDIKRDLADEMADIIFIMACLANQAGIDLQSALDANIKKKSARDIQRHQGNSKLQQP
jgi:NTP pyrophosphatase (non-canonical NTP hydrolase)